MSRGFRAPPKTTVLGVPQVPFTPVLSPGEDMGGVFNLPIGALGRFWGLARPR